jgi:periplasmic protein TonB
MNGLLACICAIVSVAVWSQEEVVAPRVESVEITVDEGMTESVTDGPVDTVEAVVTDEPPVHFLDDLPAFLEEVIAIKKYLVDSLVYPADALEHGLEGNVYIKALLSEKGQLSAAEVGKGLPDCESCNAEALRLIREMPPLRPDETGRAKPAYLVFTVRFVLPAAVLER